MSVTQPQLILDFWFDVPEGHEHGRTRSFWFRQSDQTDALIRQRFGVAVEEALRGQFDRWSATPRGTLALILLLDQFTRNIFRGQPRAFAGDARALHWAAALTDAGEDRGLSLHERWFAYLPFEHAESLPLQQRSVELYTVLAADGLAEPLSWAIRHRDVIERFGRFPHRNNIVGRESSAEEVAFLSEPGSRF